MMEGCRAWCKPAKKSNWGGYRILMVSPVITEESGRHLEGLFDTGMSHYRRYDVLVVVAMEERGKRLTMMDKLTK